jgi:hypothetical protein
MFLVEIETFGSVIKSIMQSVIPITGPQEILLGLHKDAEQFPTQLKEQSAMVLFRGGRLSSGMAASWLGVPRAHFLIKAMQGGATLLENTQEDFRRETALL